MKPIEKWHTPMKYDCLTIRNQDTCLLQLPLVDSTREEWLNNTSSHCSHTWTLARTTMTSWGTKKTVINHEKISFKAGRPIRAYVQAACSLVRHGRALSARCVSARLPQMCRWPSQVIKFVGFASVFKGWGWAHYEKSWHKWRLDRCLLQNKPIIN